MEIEDDRQCKRKKYKKINNDLQKKIHRKIKIEQREPPKKWKYRRSVTQNPE